MLTIDNIAISYDQSAVLNDVSLQLASGEIGCVLGASGCGKTTLMRAIAGFKSIDTGKMEIAGQLVASKNINMPVASRNIGVIFQDFALFPHFTVLQNVEYGINRENKLQDKQIAQRYIDLVGLTGFEDKYPFQLSGGQQQRVAIARALAPQPDLLLLDEPFSSLDPELRTVLAQEVRQIIKQNGTTALLITHDQNEAFAMSDKIGVLHAGKCEQWGSPFELYHQPKTAHVAKFIGEGSFISGSLSQNSSQVVKIATQLGEFVVEQPKLIDSHELEQQPSPIETPEQTINNAQLLVRPDDIIHDDNSPIKATVVSRNFRGAQIMYQLGIGDKHETVYCLASSHHNHAIGESFGIKLELEHVICFPD